MQSDFVLIDLVSQRDAVREFLRDVDTAFKVEWIASWGTIRVIEHPSGLRRAYAFESRFGFRTGFYFDETGDFVFLGDHYTFK